MFSQINGLPVHALAVHAAVVLVPLAALLGVLFAVPRTRAWSRLPLPLVALGALGSVFVARQSGQSLKETLGLDRGGSKVAALVAEHQSRANLLMILVVIFAVIAVAAFVLSRDLAQFNGPIAMAVSALLVLGAIVVGFQTYRVGDIGSRAVWNPEGQVDYGSSSDGDD
ncbi:MAG: hypothetical protein H0V07_08185 [Propionibacteriales bacterium]|nr:hypothetical protein [Propionibacteriales bacterium]